MIIRIKYDKIYRNLILLICYCLLWKSVDNNIIRFFFVIGVNNWLIWGLVFYSMLNYRRYKKVNNIIVSIINVRYFTYYSLYNSCCYELALIYLLCYCCIKLNRVSFQYNSSFTPTSTTCFKGQASITTQCWINRTNRFKASP